MFNIEHTGWRHEVRRNYPGPCIDGHFKGITLFRAFVVLTLLLIGSLGAPLAPAQATPVADAPGDVSGHRRRRRRRAANDWRQPVAGDRRSDRRTGYPPLSTPTTTPTTLPPPGPIVSAPGPLSGALVVPRSPGCGNVHTQVSPIVSGPLRKHHHPLGSCQSHS